MPKLVSKKLWIVPERVGYDEVRERVLSDGGGRGWRYHSCARSDDYAYWLNGGSYWEVIIAEDL